MFILLTAAISFHYVDANGESLLSAPESAITSHADIDSDVLRLGIRVGSDERKLLVDGELSNFDIAHYVAHAGFPLLPFIYIGAEAGWSKAEGPEGEGENGLEWGVVAEVNIAEHVLDHSPVFGDIAAIGFQVRAHRRWMESNLSETDFAWVETNVSPLMYYMISYADEVSLHGYNPEGAVLKGGLVFNRIDGDLGVSAIEQNRDFGFVLGLNMGFAGSWIAGIEGNYFNSDDRELNFGLMRHF